MLKGSDDALVSKNPAADLLEALRVGDIEGIEPDGKELPPETWDTVLTHDLRTWPKVRFRRADVLRLWPDPIMLPKWGSHSHKRQATDAAINKLGVAVLARMSQKEREDTILKQVADDNGGLKVSPRYARKRLTEAQKR